MPKILDRLVSQLKAQGYNASSAFAIATKMLQKAGDLKKGTRVATKQGIVRGNMTPAQREKARANHTGSYKKALRSNRIPK